MRNTLSSRGAFNRFRLLDKLQGQTELAKREIDSLNPDSLLQSTDEDLLLAVSDIYNVNPPTLLWDDAEQLPTTETSIDVSQDRHYTVFDRSRPAMIPASRITIAVPVTGDVEMLGGQASHWFPDIALTSEIHEAELHVSNSWPNPEPASIEAWWRGEKDVIERQVSSIRSEITNWQSNFKAQLDQHIRSRRARILRDRGLEGSIGLKVRTRSDRPRAVPVRRTKVATTRTLKNVSPGTPFQPEHELEQSIYFDVLDIIHHLALTWERSPRVAQKYDEEELRDQILAQLNGHFEGEAGGELFNGNGKTDILIRREGKNVFIAECKFWKGQQRFSDAIDQLNGYLIWRDTKAAIVLFIKQKDPSAVIDRATAAIRAHSQYKRDGTQSTDKTKYPIFLLEHHDDPQREIQLALVPIGIRSE